MRPFSYLLPLGRSHHEHRHPLHGLALYTRRFEVHAGERALVRVDKLGAYDRLHRAAEVDARAPFGEAVAVEHRVVLFGRDPAPEDRTAVLSSSAL